MPRGTFLVRKRDGGEYALTINDLKDDSLDVNKNFVFIFNKNQALLIVVAEEGVVL